MKFLDSIYPSVYAFLKRNPALMECAKWVIGFLNRVKALLSSRVIFQGESAPPERIHPDTRTWVEAYSRLHPDRPARIQGIHPETVYHRKKPNHIGDAPYWKFADNLAFTLPATFVAEIPGARVLDEGYVIAPDHQLLGDLSVFIGNPKQTHPALEKQALGAPFIAKGKSALLASYAGGGYYHWMIDVLPRIELLRLAQYDLSRIDHFIVNRYVADYHHEALDLLGIPRDKLIQTQWRKHIYAEHLILPSLTNVYHTTPTWACAFLRRTFLESAGDLPVPRRKIYISRGNAFHRRVSNETELVALLKDHGFETVSLERMKLVDQARLFAEALCVVGPHGAGLTNLVFCHAHTQVIEILYPQAVNLMFWTIASHADLDYFYLFAEGELPARGEDPFRNSVDLVVDLRKMALLLDQMEKGSK